MIALLPCPCCNGTVNTRGYTGNYSVGCQDCGLKTSYWLREDIAVKAWNTRAKPAPTEYATDAEIIEISTLYGGSKFSSTDEHCISFEVSQFLAFARAIAGSRK